MARATAQSTPATPYLADIRAEAAAAVESLPSEDLDWHAALVLGVGRR